MNYKETIFSAVSEMTVNELKELSKYIDDLTDAEYERARASAWNDVQKTISEYEDSFGKFELYDLDNDVGYEITEINKFPGSISIQKI